MDRYSFTVGDFHPLLLAGLPGAPRKVRHPLPKLRSGNRSRFTYEELIARNHVNLDLIWLKDESETDSANLPDPDTLIVEIVDKLTAAARELAAAASSKGTTVAG